MPFPFELTVREPKELDRIMPLLREFDIHDVHLTHTNDNMDRLAVLRELKTQSPETTATYTLSAKFHTSQTFLKELFAAYDLGVRRFLVVSGYPKKDFDSCQAIELLSHTMIPADLELACVYNPYVNEDDARRERERLERKLSFDIIKSLYFQIGIDQEKLRRALSHVQTLNRRLSLYGELIAPNPTVLEHLRAKPWYGVDLGPVYLNDLQKAEQQTTELKTFYDEHRITPLILVLPFLRENLSEIQSVIRS